METNLAHDYEVKILLKPSEVLESNGKLKDVVLSTFFRSWRAKTMNVQFVDTKEKDFYTNGWNLRIRKKEDDDEFELTYKKRYPISDGDSGPSTGNINAVLRTAEKDGFDSASFLSQVEVGYRNHTLSISHDENVSDAGFDGTDLPLAEDSRTFLASEAPEKFKNWSAPNWGTDHLADSVVYGPVLAKRYQGNWEDEFKLFIEVWWIRKSRTDATLEPIVEASFKTADFEKATDGRDKLMRELQKQNRVWFLAGDALRTKLIMERYEEVPPKI